MPLIKCPECHKEISDKASTCPQCGFPIRKAALENALAGTLVAATSGAQKAVEAVIHRKSQIKKCVYFFVRAVFILFCIGIISAITRSMQKQHHRDSQRDFNKYIAQRTRDYDRTNSLPVYIKPQIGIISNRISVIRTDKLPEVADIQHQETLLILNLFKISIPTNLVEHRLAEDQQKIIERLKAEGFGKADNEPLLLLQQKGLALKDSAALKTHLMISILYTSPKPSVFKDIEHMKQLYPEEISLFSESSLIALKQIVNSEQTQGRELKITAPPTSSLVNINGASALKTTYKDRTDNNFELLHTSYTILVNQKMFTIEIEYRVNDSELWDEPVRSLVHSISFF